MPTIKNGISIYRLKTMVIARLFSELTVILLVMIGSIYLLVNYNATLPWPLKIILTLLILLALIFSYSYAFVVFEVRVDDSCIETIALTKRIKAYFLNIKDLKLKRNLFYKLYQLNFENKEVSFSTWFYDLDDLLLKIKQQLPKSELGLNNPIKTSYTCEKLSYGLNLFKVLLSMIFIAVLFVFTLNNIHNSHEIASNKIILGLFFAAIALFIIYRNIFIILSPISLNFNQDSINMKNLFYQKNILYSEISILKPAPAWMSEGLYLKTKQGSYLLSLSFSELTEIEEFLINKINKK